MLHLNSGKDYRFGGKKEVRTYFWPANESTNHEVDTLFKQVAGGDAYKSGAGPSHPRVEVPEVSVVSGCKTQWCV